MKYEYKCDVCGRDVNVDSVITANGLHLCCKHYQQYIKYHKFLDNNPRSIQDPNEYRIDYENNCIIMDLYKRSYKVAECLFDLDDLDRVTKYKWRLWRDRVWTGNGKETERIQAQYFVLNRKPQKGFVVDHINSNPLDNRKCNLRVTTQWYNRKNNKLNSNNTSGFCGVAKNKNSWSAQIKYNYISCNFGTYNNICDAVYARYVAENILFKEFRSTQNDENIMTQIALCENKENIEKFVISQIINTYGKSVLN